MLYRGLIIHSRRAKPGPYYLSRGADFNALSTKPRTALPRLSSSLPGERTIDFIDDQIKLRADLNSLPRLYQGAEPGPFPREQISTLYLRLYRPLERTLMLYPGLFHLAEGSRTRPLLSIPGEQISTLYAFTLHPGGAGHTLHGRLSQSLRPLLSISGA